MAASDTPAAPTRDAMAEFWRGRRVLLTGHTGFKGAWMSLWLGEMGAEVTGYALSPAAEPNLWNILAAPAAARAAAAPGRALDTCADIRDAERVGEAVARADPQIVIHMAAQALVRESYRDPLATYATNVMGTAALAAGLPISAPLSSASSSSPATKSTRIAARAAPSRRATGWAAMILTATARPARNWWPPVFATVFLPTGRPSPPRARAMSSAGATGRRIGSFPTASGRFDSGKAVNLRYPDAVRPWQHVLEPLSGYLALAQALVTRAESDAARCQFRPGPGILLHGARGGGRIWGEICGQARMGERPGAAARGGAGPDPVFGLGRTGPRLASKAGHTRIAVVDGRLVFGPFGRREHGDIFRGAAGALPRTDEPRAMTGLVTACRACGGRLTVTMADLGLQPASNAYLTSLDAAHEEKRYPLRAMVCESCKLVQVDYDVAPQELFGNYAYFSSYSDGWLAHAKEYCVMARRRFGLGSASLVVELASNDGYLLKNFIDMGVPVLGIDPSDTVAAAAEKIGVPTLVEFFGESLARDLAGAGRQADLIIGNNVLAHVPVLNDFVAGIARLLKPKGSATLEFPHLLELIEHVEFDTIYHEHYSYISLFAIEQVFSRHGLRLYDVGAIADARRLIAYLRRTLGSHGPRGQRARCASCGRRRAPRGWLIWPPIRDSRSASKSAGDRCWRFSPRRGARERPSRLTAPRRRAILCSIFAQ